VHYLGQFGIIGKNIIFYRATRVQFLPANNKTTCWIYLLWEDQRVHIVGNRAMKKQKNLALKPRSSLQGGGNGSHTSLIKLAEEFVDDEIDVVTSRFPQLTSVSREKMYYPPSFPMI
jgi:hypothetical protein